MFDRRKRSPWGLHFRSIANHIKRASGGSGFPMMFALHQLTWVSKRSYQILWLLAEEAL